MQFYRYWARDSETAQTPDGREIEFLAYGYSNFSLEDALRVARERANRNISQQVWNHESRQRYYGSDSPLREEIVQELKSADGEQVIISRNAYGCLVMNTPNVFFADIDRPENSANAGNLLEGIAGFFQNLFGSSPSKASSAEDSFEASVISKIEELIRHSPETVIRLYRTSNGFRAMILNETIPCDLAKSNRMLNAFGSDELYISLCRSQDCYRARLTPKPWRCGLDRPTLRYPFASADEQSRFASWLEEYESRAREYAICALIGNFGNGYINQTCQQIAEVHDSYVLNGNQPLA